MTTLVKLIAGLVLAAAIAAPAAAAASGLRPNDRAVGSRSEISASGTLSIRPDDRAGYRGPFFTTRQATAPSASGDSFDFGDAALGAVAATGAILVVFGTALVVIRRRTRFAL
jgi:hypothetical protein